MSLVVLLTFASVAIQYFEFLPLIVLAKYYMYAALPILTIVYLATEQRALLSAILIVLLVIVLIGSIVIIYIGHPYAIIAKWVLFGLLVFGIISFGIWNRNTKEGEGAYRYQFKAVAALFYLLFVGFIFLATGSIKIALGIGGGIPIAILVVLIVIEVAKILVKRSDKE